MRTTLFLKKEEERIWWKELSVYHVSIALLGNLYMFFHLIISTKWRLNRILTVFNPIQSPSRKIKKGRKYKAIFEAFMRAHKPCFPKPRPSLRDWTLDTVNTEWKGYELNANHKGIYFICIWNHGCWTLLEVKLT